MQRSKVSDGNVGCNAASAKKLQRGSKKVLRLDRDPGEGQQKRHCDGGALNSRQPTESTLPR